MYIIVLPQCSKWSFLHGNVTYYHEGDDTRREKNQKTIGGTICIERHLSGWIREKAINRSLQQPLFERGECSIFLQGCIATWKMTRILQEYLHHGNHASSNVISLPPPCCYPLPWPFSIIQTIDWWIDATSFPQLQLPSISYSIKAAFDEGLLRLTKPAWFPKTKEKEYGRMRPQEGRQIGIKLLKVASKPSLSGP